MSTISWIASCLLVAASLSFRCSAAVATATLVRASNSRTCTGTANGLNLTPWQNPVAQLLSTYANCTKVLGNLELTTLKLYHQITDDQLAFLDNIEEVTGYVLIAHNDIPRLPLRGLKIIWGRELFEPAVDPRNSSRVAGKHFGLFVYNNRGLETLDLNRLRAVENGDIFVGSNPLLCSLSTIDWSQLLDVPNERNVVLGNNHDQCYSSAGQRCDATCSGRCWGKERNQCQIVYRQNCAAECANRMSFSSADRAELCCDPECVGGCFGPGSDQCHACKHVRHNSHCLAECPKSKELQRVPFQGGFQDFTASFRLDDGCVTKCPEYMLIENDSCVSRCSANFEVSEETNECVPCTGVCQSECSLLEPLSSLNMRSLENCTTLNGNLEILTNAMQDRWQRDYKDGEFTPKYFVKGLTLKDLTLLSTVRIVTEYVVIELRNENFTSLDFILGNLQTILGRVLYRGSTGLQIAGTTLTQLGLKSLKKVNRGNVAIYRNDNLCYSHDLSWREISADGAIIASSGYKNRAACAREGRVCDETCESDQGCWGPGPSMCFG